MSHFAGYLNFKHYFFVLEINFSKLPGIIFLYVRYEGALDPWLLSLWESLNKANPSLLPRITDIINPNLNYLGDSKIEVIYYSCNDTPPDSIVSGLSCRQSF